jgi:hypothetical protein
MPSIEKTVLAKHFLAIAALAALASAMMPSSARADEAVYTGEATVKQPGSRPAACAGYPIKVTVADGRFSYGAGGAPLATGAVATDGSFSANYSSSPGPRVTIQIAVTGRIQDGKVIGSSSTSSGCLQDFTLTKQ